MQTQKQYYEDFEIIHYIGGDSVLFNSTLQKEIDIVLWPLEEKHFESKNVAGRVSDTNF